MQKIIILLLIIGGLIGGWWYASAQNWLPEQARLVLPHSEQDGDQLAVLSSRAQGLGGVIQGFFSQNVQVNDNQPSLQQRAIEYGQYIYCKQVVATYESQQ